MINLSFDNGTVEQFTLVLSQRDYTHLGQISNIKGLKFKANLNGANELSFDVYKELDGHEEILWDDIYDLRLVWIPELDEYFEIDVESTDQVYVVKTVTGRSLCESELSQTYLHDIEINTADDIAREDYDANYPTVFYRPLPDPSASDYEKLKSASLLHRIMDKVPAYSIGHVDETLMNLQRVFSISDTTLYDFMTGECSEQFNCLFQFDSATRTISAYDLETTCHNDYCPYYLNTNHEYYSGDKHLRYRGFYNDKCPICGSTNISYFGEDTTVFVSTENLTDEVKFDTDVASLKNCFRLEAGDDNMTAAVINSNPNGTRYIYEFNEESKKDMPEELVNLIDKYDVLYDEYNNTTPMEVVNEHYSTPVIIKKYDGTTITCNTMMEAFNAICLKYNDNIHYQKGTPWSEIPLKNDAIKDTNINGYKRLIPHYYNCIDFYQYLKSSMMPVITVEQRDIDDEMDHLLNDLDSTIGMSTQPTVQATVESAITNICKLYVNTGLYKIKVNTTSWSSSSWTTWRGTITLTSFEDDSITKTSDVIPLTLSTDFATFMDQKISKYIKRSKESTELYDVLKITDINTFKNELKKYSAVRLQSFHDALAAVLGILVEAGQGNAAFSKVSTPSGNPKSKGWYEIVSGSYVLTNDTTVVSGKTYYQRNAVLYDSFYTPYYNKLVATETELNTRNQEIEIVNGIQDANGNSTKKGVLQYIMDSIVKVQTALNFKEFTNSESGSYELYNIYTTYIRENTYSNSNYISDDLNNDQLFENAGRFLELAKDELHKSATYQHSITSNLNNLMAIDEFKPLLDKFNLGNWIRVKEDENIYRLRLISYSIDFDNISKLNTEFSDVTITTDGLNDVMSIMKQASSMASSYSYTQQQAEQGSDVKVNYIDDWLANGLNSALVRINNNDDEDISVDNTGILARSYDDVADTHSPEQLRITHNVIAFTDDNWQSVKTALGKFDMTHHPVNADGVNKSATPITYSEYGLVANAVLAGWIVGSYMESSTVIASHVQNVGNSNYMDLGSNTTNDDLKYFLKSGSNFTVDKSGNLKCTSADVSGKITADSGKIGAWNIEKDSATESEYTYARGGLYYGTPSNSSGYIIAPYNTKSNYAYAGATTRKWKVMLGTGFGIDSSGNVFIKGAIHATSGDFGTSTTKVNIGDGCIYYGKSTIDHDSAGFYVGSSGLSCGKVVSAANGGWGVSAFKVTNAGALYASNAYIAGTIKASNGNIGGWTIDPTGLHASDAWVEPNLIACGQHGATHVKMRGRDDSGDNSGYLSVEVNDGSDAVRVFIDNVRKYDAGGNSDSVVWHSEQNESDIRLKEKIEELSLCQSLEFINSLIPKQYKFKKADGIRYGFIAQDIEHILDDNYGIVYEESDGYKHLNYIDIIAPLVKVVQDQQKQINYLMRLKGEQNG